MSGTNDIVFDDLKFREPRRLTRPDRDPTRACIVYGIPQPGELAIFLDHGPADAIERHALTDTSVELGGILLGWECIDERTHEPFVWITQSIEARYYESTQASFTYTHDAWEEITRERDRLFPNLDIVGWYHTHPDFGIFLSGHDLFIHQHFFSQPLQVAYVVDPIRQTRGCFQWRDGQVHPVGGFGLTAWRADRPKLARFVNDLENLPVDLAGDDASTPRLGGLTPRLEAQLIDMLKRGQSAAASHHHGGRPGEITYPGSPPGRVSGASVLFVLIGLVLGMGLFWLAGLNRQLQTQAALLQAIRAATADLAHAAETDPELVARTAAKEQALDALLQEVRVEGEGGVGTQPILDAYTRATTERDEARHQAQAARIEKTALTEMAARLRSELESTQKALQRASAGNDQVIEVQKNRLAEQQATIDAQNRLLTETRAGELQRKYAIAWYAGLGLAILSALLTLGLVWVVTRRPLDDDDANPNHPVVPVSPPSSASSSGPATPTRPRDHA